MLRIGMLTPSSNTVLEPTTYALLRNHAGVSAHFSRFKVTEIALTAAALGQFDDGPILAAAELLAQARCDVIAWNGTSASWLGFDRDEALVRRIEAATGVPAATCVLGYRAVFRRFNVQRVGLVTPYTRDVQDRISANWKAAGFDCVAERHCGLSDNFSFAQVRESDVDSMVRDVARSRPEAVAIVCTNMRGALVAAELERQLGILVLDSVAVTLWTALQRVGADTSPFKTFGRLFAS